MGTQSQKQEEGKQNAIHREQTGLQKMAIHPTLTDERWDYDRC